MPEIPDLKDAIGQLAEFFGFEAEYRFKVGDEEFVITYRQFVPVDVEERLIEVDKLIKSCDREEIEMPNGQKVKTLAPAIPLIRDGNELANGPDALRLIAMWGEEKYRRFEAAGGPPGMLTAVWAMQEALYKEWAAAGSKRRDGDSPVEAQRKRD